MTMYYGALPSRPRDAQERLRVITRDGLEVLCAWCLAEAEISFPDEATSTICPRHRRQVLAQAKLAKLEKLAALSAPAAPEPTEDK